MKINKLKINAYAGLKDREIILENNINIIEGKNESGKSTLLNFILNMFYGIAKTKNGKEFSDFDRFKPWIGEEFSGKIDYTLDNNKKYEIFRDFKKKNVKLFDENMEEISKYYNTDKSRGSEFFYEQTKVPEELFLSTLLVTQQQVKLEKTEQNILVQKIANIVGTGEDNISYENAIKKLNKKITDEIGTEKTREKPINILYREKEKLENEMEKINNFNKENLNLIEQIKDLAVQIEIIEKELDFIKASRKVIDKTKIERERVKLQEKLLKENENQIENFNIDLEELIKEENIINEKNKVIRETNEEKIKQRNKTSKLIFLILLILNIVQIAVIKENIIKYILLLSIPLYLIITIRNNIKLKQKLEKLRKERRDINNNEKVNELKNKIQILENNNSNIEKDIEAVNSELNVSVNNQLNIIKNDYKNSIDLNSISILEKICIEEKFDVEIEKRQEEINSRKININRLEIYLEEVKKTEERAILIKEKNAIIDSNLSELTNKTESIELAKEVLKESYDEMKNTVTPKFTKKISEIVNNIIKDKYKELKYNDETGLMLELENGNYEPISKLSIGTIDQIYLALRLSMTEDLYEEDMPIILDEAFAYYDTDRMKNIFLYLNSQYKNKQILIFTCTKREEEILKELNIKYNKIIL